ncbi:MAG: family 43 glycosylhydrolase [Opitutales bacterium]|nr:family 43 glycosylhydrolase [Opitutales bacterium]
MANSLDWVGSLNALFLVIFSVLLQHVKNFYPAFMMIPSIPRLASFLLLGSVFSASLQAKTGDAWLFTSFRGDGDGLHLAYSLDGKDWTDLHQTYLQPQVGSCLMRDPHILRGPDGVYHMVWTSGWGDKGIGYATSNDLLHWSEQRYIPLMEHRNDANTCWAPELYYLEETGQYMIVWTSSTLLQGFSEPQHRAYYVLTKDFSSFTEPKILFDPGFSNIDTTMQKTADGRYRIFFKETDDQQAQKWGRICSAVAPNPTGPYILDPVPVLQNMRVEGPAPMQLGNEMLMYVDHYVDHKYSVYSSADGHQWQDVTPYTHVVEGQRHGSVVQVPGDLVSSLREVEQSALEQVPPALLSEFTADPSIRVFGDKYYIYPTSDRPNWNTSEFAVWSSPNLVDWTKESVAMDIKTDLEWGHNRAWAPDCIERNGKYYFYFCTEGVIGVAVGDSPAGPFKDALGHPLIVRSGKVDIYPIDPNVFIDDDGQAYLYFGNGRCAQVFKLKEDMITLDGDPVDIFLKDFREGIWVFKRDGKYYFMWSIDDARSPDYRIGWGVADSPLGPVSVSQKNFVVLRQHGLAQGTGHHSVVNVPGSDRWYVVYHRHAVPDGSGFRRQICIVEMKFAEDGSILPMDPLTDPFAENREGEPLE